MDRPASGDSGRLPRAHLPRPSPRPRDRPPASLRPLIKHAASSSGPGGLGSGTHVLARLRATRGLLTTVPPAPRRQKLAAVRCLPCATAECSRLAAAAALACGEPAPAARAGCKPPPRRPRARPAPARPLRSARPPRPRSHARALARRPRRLRPPRPRPHARVLRRRLARPSTASRSTSAISTSSRAGLELAHYPRVPQVLAAGLRALAPPRSSAASKPRLRPIAGPRSTPGRSATSASASPRASAAPTPAVPCSCPRGHTTSAASAASLGASACCGARLERLATSYLRSARRLRVVGRRPRRTRRPPADSGPPARETPSRGLELLDLRLAELHARPRGPDRRPRPRRAPPLQRLARARARAAAALRSLPSHDDRRPRPRSPRPRAQRADTTGAAGIAWQSMRPERLHAYARRLLALHDTFRPDPESAGLTCTRAPARGRNHRS